MIVDVVAALQGLHNTKEVGDELREAIRQVFIRISYSSKVGRSICEYDKLLVGLSEIKIGTSYELFYFWQNFGKSLAYSLEV